MEGMGGVCLITASVILRAYRDLSLQAKYLYLLLLAHAEGKRYCSPYIAQLAEEFGCKERNIQRLLRELEDKKLIGRGYRTGESSLIWLFELDPEEIEKGTERYIDGYREMIRGEIRHRKSIAEIEELMEDEKLMVERITKWKEEKLQGIKKEVVEDE